MSRVVEAIGVFIVSIFIFYLLEATFGTVIDQIGFQLGAIYIAGNGHADWATNVLNLFPIVHRFIFLLLIATGVWVFKIVIWSSDYTRGQY